MMDSAGERIKELMKRRGMSQTKLARMSGVSQAMISKIISGCRRGNRSTMRRIENALGTERGSLSKQRRTLRDVLESCDTDMYKKKFAEAEALASSIFDSDTGYVPLSYFTGHGVEHCQFVEMYIDEIVLGNNEDSRFDFEPTPEEAMYLLSAAWLHDIGMMYCIFDGEKPEDLEDDVKVASLREEHEYRTAKYIHEKWKKSDGCSWSNKEKTWLSNICVYHRRKHPIEGFEPVEEVGRHGRDPIRLRVLAALTRLADICYVSQSRAPGPLRVLYHSLGMPPEAVCHWEKSRLISEVYFDHIDKKIIFSGQCPAEFKFYLGSFDLEVVVNMVTKYVEEELWGVQKILSRYPNTCFIAVENKIEHVKALDYMQKQQFLSLWPYFLSRPLSATEAAAALAQILLLSTEQAEERGDLGKVWREEMHQIMEKTKSLREYDFMIRNLYIRVTELLSDIPENTQSATKLTMYLKRFMRLIEDNCRRLVGHALGEIGPDDVLILYGHSINIEELLTYIAKRHLLYIVDCYKALDGHQILDENKKITEVVKGLGFSRYKFLQLPSLAEALGELKRKKVPCKLLLGTHGRLNDGDLLCQVGTHIVAATAKRFGVEVIAFCDTMKFLVDSVKDEEIATPEKLFSSEDEKMHPQLVNVPYVAPKMDRLPRSLLDFVVTEEGVFTTEDWVPEKKVLSKTREGGEG